MITAVSRIAARVSRRVRGFVRRISIKRFPDSLHISPMLCCDREHGCWGYPGCWWVSVGWLRWTLQIALHDRPREGCLYWIERPAVFNEHVLCHKCGGTHRINGPCAPNTSITGVGAVP